MQKQLVNLELSQKLKELGVKQESMFYWKSPTPEHGRDNWEIGESKDSHAQENYSAFSVAELGEILPSIIQKEYSPRYEIEYNFPVSNDKKYTDSDWVIRYRCEEDSFKNIGVTAKTEANARAKMLRYLLENNLITL